MYNWYEKHLGIARQHGFVAFPWRDDGDPDQQGMTVWSIFSNKSEYFGPGPSRLMLNYRVEDMDALLDALQAEGVEIAKREDSEYGRFAWIVDPEGNRIELWEPPKETAQKPSE
jgi:predicted enzyme related to lactoylglutathione lyase